MTERTDRLLGVVAILLALLVVSQTTVVPRNQVLGSIGLVVGAVAAAYAFVQVAGTYR